MVSVLLCQLFLSGFSQFNAVFPKIDEVILHDESLGNVRAVKELAKDRILILDSRNCELKLFDSAGVLLNRAGGKGQGPGEMQAPTDFAVGQYQIYVCDVQTRKVHIYDRSSLKYLRSFHAIDSWEIHLFQENLFLVAPHLENNTSIHVFDQQGKMKAQLLPIPKITKDHRLVASGVSMDVDAQGRLFAIHEMDYQIHRFGNDLVFEKAFKGNHRFYEPPPDGTFNEFYSRKKLEKWLFSWTHLQRIVCLNNPEVLLVSMSHFEPAFEGLDVYGMNGQFLIGWKIGQLRLLSASDDHHVLFLDMREDDESPFRIQRRGFVEESLPFQ